MNKILALLLGVLLCGCSAKDTAKDAKAEYDKITSTKAYKVFNFAINATNPLYYASEGAKAGYSQYKKSKENNNDGQ